MRNLNKLNELGASGLDKESDRASIIHDDGLQHGLYMTSEPTVTDDHWRHLAHGRAADPQQVQSVVARGC